VKLEPELELPFEPMFGQFAFCVERFAAVEDDIEATFAG
jgi:hypothetical protein